MRVIVGKAAILVAVLVFAVSGMRIGSANGEVLMKPRLVGPLAFDGPIPASVRLPLNKPGDLERELHCLAQNIYFEARSEPFLGQLGVAMVALNRVRSDRFPDTICGVVRQGGPKRRRCQFSWYCDGKADRPTNTVAWQRAKDLAQRVLFGRVDDPTGGAMWYHADYVKPRWARHLRRTQRIGRHLYYGDS